MAIKIKGTDSSVPVKEFSEPAKDIAKYFRKKKIDVVLVNGISAQSGATMVKSKWKKLFPGEKMPKFIATGKIKQLDNGLIMTRRTGLIPQHELEKILKKRLSNIPHNSKIAIFDEMIIRGNQINTLKDIMHNLGFKKIKTCTLYKGGGKFKVTKVDFIASKGASIHAEVYFTRRYLFNKATNAKYSDKLNGKMAGKRDTLQTTLKKIKDFRARLRK